MQTPVGRYSGQPHRTIDELVEEARVRALNGEQPYFVTQDLVNGYSLGWLNENHRRIEAAANLGANEKILALKMDKFDAVQGPRVGDFIRLKQLDPRQRAYTRITYIVGDHAQTGGSDQGAYDLFGSGLNSSGSLDPGVGTEFLIPTAGTKLGSVWFFDQNIVGVGRRVTFFRNMRVFDLEEGASISGIGEFDTGYRLLFRDQEWSILLHGMSELSTYDQNDVEAWLHQNQFSISADIRTERQRINWPQMRPKN